MSDPVHVGNLEASLAPRLAHLAPKRNAKSSFLVLEIISPGNGLQEQEAVVETYVCHMANCWGTALANSPPRPATPRALGLSLANLAESWETDGKRAGSMDASREVFTYGMEYVHPLQ